TRLTQAAHPELPGLAHQATDRHYAMQVQRLEVALATLDDLGIRNFRADVVQQPQPGHVGNGLDVEDQDRCSGHDAQPPARKPRGSIGLPLRRTSNPSRALSVPVAPTSAIFWPRVTLAPSFTRILLLCA